MTAQIIPTWSPQNLFSLLEVRGQLKYVGEVAEQLCYLGRRVCHGHRASFADFCPGPEGRGVVPGEMQLVVNPSRGSSGGLGLSFSVKM